MKHLFSPEPAWIRTMMAFLFICSLSLLHAQTAQWTLQSEKSGVKLYSATGTCDGVQTLFLKFENSNPTAKHVAYNIIAESPGNNIPLLPQSVQLGAGETKAGSCKSNVQLTAELKTTAGLKLVVVMTVN